ncbi:UNVERIFIED_CONTAM: hypothetical protein Sradi_7205200 [Sesamum radiatum]|uniref:Uncharacterized protein n=1 Tax=Sesamum radiatum TaxID=300843 RepID=A0AAW2IR07_SESRA
MPGGIPKSDQVLDNTSPGAPQRADPSLAIDNQQRVQTKLEREDPLVVNCGSSEKTPLAHRSPRPKTSSVRQH